MSESAIEGPEERRARYLRLARAAMEAAAKSPLPGAKEMYVKLAQPGWQWRTSTTRDLAFQRMTRVRSIWLPIAA